MYTYRQTIIQAHTNKYIYIGTKHTYKHTYIHAYIHTDKQAVRQTYIQTDKQAYRHTYIHTYRHTYRGRHIYRHTYIQSYTHTYIQGHIQAASYRRIQCNTHTHIHTYIQAGTDTYIHTPTGRQPCRHIQRAHTGSDTARHTHTHRDMHLTWWAGIQTVIYTYMQAVSQHMHATWVGLKAETPHTGTHTYLT